MNQILEIVIAFFLVVGAAFAFIGSLGLFKLNDFYMRLHGPTKATTLGLGGMLTASAIYFTFTTPVISLHEVLISMFLFITAPVSAHILAKTAMHKHFEFVGGQEDPLRHPMNLHVPHVALPVDDSDEIIAVSDDVAVGIERVEEQEPEEAEAGEAESNVSESRLPEAEEAESKATEAVISESETAGVEEAEVSEPKDS